ncbi:MAG: hypothetical protein AAF546_03165 [Verrucomicrobiota bacterium]
MQQKKQIFSAELRIGDDHSGWIAGRVTGGDLHVGDVLIGEGRNESKEYQIEEIEAHKKSLTILPIGMAGALKLKGLPDSGLNLPCLLFGKGISSRSHQFLSSFTLQLR